MARRRPILLTGTLTLAVLAAACGGGDAEVETESGQEPDHRGGPVEHRGRRAGRGPGRVAAAWASRRPTATSTLRRSW